MANKYNGNYTLQKKAQESIKQQNGEQKKQEDKPKQQFSDLLTKYKNQIEMAIPEHLTAERVIRMALTATSRNPKLLQCASTTLIGSVITASQLGLEIDVLGQAYMVPFWNNRAKRMEAQLIPGYQGLNSLAQRTGKIANMHASEVREHDGFDYEFGSNARLYHKPGLNERGEVVAFYAYAKTIDGGFYFTVMSKNDVDFVKDNFSSSKNKKGEIVGPWTDNEVTYIEMGKKTCFRRLSKILPKSIEFQKLEKAVTLDELAARGISQNIDIENMDDEGMIPINDKYEVDDAEYSEETETPDPSNGEKEETPEQKNSLSEKDKKEIEEWEDPISVVAKIEALYDPNRSRQGNIKAVNDFKKEHKSKLEAFSGKAAEIINKILEETELKILDNKETGEKI